MNFFVIALLTGIGLTLDHVSCLTSSSEDTIKIESEYYRYPHLYPPPMYPPPLYPPSLYPPPLYPPPMYPPPYNPHQIPAQNCQMCVAMVTYLNHFRGNSEYSRNNALHTVCFNIGTANYRRCQQFVQNYGPKLAYYLRPYDNAYNTCKYIQVC